MPDDEIQHFDGELDEEELEEKESETEPHDPPLAPDEEDDF